MAPKQRMSDAIKRFDGNITQRGNVAKSQRSSNKGYPTSTWIIGLFIFVVCGSAIFEIIRAASM